MNNGKHTPGPWQTTGSLVFHQRNPGGKKFYVVDCLRSEMTSEMTVANAKLIAAAPELLSALKEAHGVIDAMMAYRISQEPDFYPSQSQYWPTIKTIVATIRKAGSEA